MATVEKSHFAVRPVIVKFVDMPYEMKHEAIDCARRALMKFYEEKEMANYIRIYFEEKYGITWHVIVGRNFGNSVYYEENNYIYFYIGQMGFVIFKSGAL